MGLKVGVVDGPVLGAITDVGVVVGAAVGVGRTTTILRS